MGWVLPVCTVALPSIATQEKRRYEVPPTHQNALVIVPDAIER
jgi:hypothetical protein